MLGFVIWVVSNFLTFWYQILYIIKTGKGIMSLKVFKRDVKISKEGYVHQYFTFKCGMSCISLKQ